MAKKSPAPKPQHVDVGIDIMGEHCFLAMPLTPLGQAWLFNQCFDGEGDPPTGPILGPVSQLENMKAIAHNHGIVLDS